MFHVVNVKSIMYIVAIISLFVIVLTMPTVSTSLGFCYFQPDGNLDPTTIDPNLCTHIIVFSVKLANENISATKPVRTAIGKVVPLKRRNPKLKVLVSLFDKSDNWTDYDFNSETRIAQNVREFLDRNNLDGLDIFYNEGKNAQQKCSKVDILLKQLQTAFSDEYILTICIGYKEGQCAINDKTVDFVLVRSFLLNGNRDVTGHDSPLDSTDNTDNPYSDIRKVTTIMQQNRSISNDKLVMGFPLFSTPQTRDNKFPVTTAEIPANKRNINYEDLPIFIMQNLVNYPNLCAQYSDTEYKWDEKQHASYISSGFKWLSFDSKRGICYKTSWLAKKEHNAGYMVWTLDMDDQNKTCGDERFPIAAYLKNNFGKKRTDEECDNEIAWTRPIYCSETQSRILTEYTYKRSYPNTITRFECATGSVSRRCVGAIDKSYWDVEMDNDCKEGDELDKWHRGVQTDPDNESEDQHAKKGRTLLGALENLAGNRVVPPDTMRGVVQSVNDISKLALTNRTVAKLMLSIIGNLMKLNTKTWKRADEEFGGTKKVRDILEKKFAAKLEFPYGMKNISIVSENIFVAVYDITALTRDETLTVHCGFIGKALGNNDKLRPTVIIPNTEDFLRRNIRRIEVVAYRNSTLFTAPDSTRVRNKYSVLSINPGGGKEHEKNAIVAKYRIPQPANDVNRYSCVFWDRLIRNWSTEGIILKTDGGNKTCFTNHLSSFSILIVAKTDEPIPEIHEISLSYISYIGCGMSLLGLLLTIITFALFKSLHRDKSGKILLNMCVAMILLNVAFFALDDLKTRSIGACMAEAFALHYFLLATLLWMTIEALHMYEKLIVVFVESRPWFMRLRMIFGWGIPLIVACFTAVYTKDYFKDTNEQCFISHINPDVFYCVVLAPACLIILVNTFVFIRVSAIIVKHRSTAGDSSKRKGTSLTSVVSLTQVRGAMSVMFVLGVAWIFGPLAIGSQRLVFLYLFAIFNSIQGFLVFLFRCALNREARLSWKYYITTGKIKQRRGSFASTTRWKGDRSTQSQIASFTAPDLTSMSVG